MNAATTTPSIPTPALHADTIVAAIKDAFPLATVKRSDSPDHWNNVFSTIRATIEVASGLEDNSETGKLTVLFPSIRGRKTVRSAGPRVRSRSSSATITPRSVRRLSPRCATTSTPNAPGCAP